MTSAELKIELEPMTAHKNARLKVTGHVIDNPELLDSLLGFVFKVDSEISFKAAWVLELVCLYNLDLLSPHLNYFTSNLKFVKNDSAVRPLSKICELIAKAHTSKKESIVKDVLTHSEIDQIVETSFDWLIGPYKVAAKAFAMSTLYLFGKNSDWIHEELQLIIEKDIQRGSPAYCSRGRKVLGLLNKNK